MKEKVLEKINQEDKSELIAEKTEQPKWFRSKKFWFVFAIILIFLGAPFLALHFLYPTTTPFKAISYLRYHRSHPHQNLAKRTIGFVPSWQIDKIPNARFDLLSDIVYFSLSIDDQGNFAKKDTKGKDDPGWLVWNQPSTGDLLAKSQIFGDRTGLTISALNNKKIENFLDSDSAQKKLITSTIKEVKKKHLKLINLDFEYTGEPPEDVPAKFTAFVSQMKSSLDTKAPGTELDINLMARSGRDPKLFDIPQLSTSVDHFIVMSYDYYTGGSDSAGPVAPMNGYAEKKYFFDVTTTYSDLAKLLPSDKIIMGIPYYGYDWPVKDKNNPRSLALPQSDTNGYVETVSYGRARDDSTFSGSNCHFDELAKVPWCGYTDPKTGKDRVAWFENNQSLEIKYNYAKEQNFAGIAIWTLGYDRNYPDLWEILARTFAK